MQNSVRGGGPERRLRRGARANYHPAIALPMAPSWRPSASPSRIWSKQSPPQSDACRPSSRRPPFLIRRDVVAAVNRLEAGYGSRVGEVIRGTEWLGRPLSRMKRLRYQRPRLGIGLIMALAIGTVAGVFGYYGVLVWRLFVD
jgi:hypothetical protein